MGIWDDYAARVQLALGPALNRTDRWGRYIAETDDDERMVVQPDTEDLWERRNPSVIPLVYDFATSPAGRTLEYDPVPDRSRFIPVRGMRGGRSAGRRPYSEPYAPIPAPEWWPQTGDTSESNFKRPPPPKFLRSPLEAEELSQGAAAGAVTGGILGAHTSEMARRSGMRRKTKAERERERVEHMDECDRKNQEDRAHCKENYSMFGRTHTWYNGCLERADKERDLCYRRKPLVPRWGDSDSDGLWTIHEKKPALPPKKPKIYIFEPDEY